MATKAEEDLSDHIERIRADIAALSETVAHLVSDTRLSKSDRAELQRLVQSTKR